VLVLPPAAEAVVLLGEIGELEVEGERPEHGRLPVGIEGAHRFPQLVARRAVSRGAGQVTDPLLGLEQILPFLLDEDATEDLAEQANVAAERRVGVDFADRSGSVRPLPPSGGSAMVPRFTPRRRVRGRGNGASGLAKSWGFFVGPKKLGGGMIKVEAVVVRDRVETVIDAVEELTGHVGVTVVEAVGHGRQRGITHEYRGRVFESRFLPKALLVFVVDDDRLEAVVEAIADAARTGHESGDGIVWTTPVENVTHNRTGKSLEEVEVG
jgi:nitrogen regulatory protein P-II 1